MASGATDRLDVTGWIPSARSSATPRSGWDAAGVAARAGDSSQDRFAAALSASRARDAAAAARTRDESQRSQADAARTAAERVRDAAETAKARAAARPDARPANLPKPPERPAQTQRTAAADTRPATTRTATQAPAKQSDLASAGAGRVTDPRAQQASDAVTREAAPGATDATTAGTDSKAGDPAATETAQIEPAPSDVSAQTAPPSASPAMPGTLTALLAGLMKGAPLVAGGAAADGGAKDVGAVGSGGTGLAGSGTAPTQAAGAAGAKPDLAVSGPKAGPLSLGKLSAQGASPVEAVKAGTADPAGKEAASSAAAGQDFLTALADAGQATGQATGMQAPAPAHGNPDASLLAPQAAGSSNATTQAAAPAPSQVQAPPDPAVPLGQVPMTIGLRSLAGSSEFQIRLDPAELGRIDVKLEIDKARGTVMTHLVVERPETLAMLQRDAGQLQQALSQTGLDPSGGGLSLSLRSDGNAQGGANGGQGDAPRGGPAAWGQERADAPQEVAPTRWLRGYGGLDIRI